MDVNAPASSRQISAHPLQNVDPELLDDEQLAEVAATVTTSAVTELCDQILAEPAPDTEADLEQGDVDLHLFSEADAHAALASVADESGVEEDNALFVLAKDPASTPTSAGDFVARYSKVNVVSGRTFANAYLQLDDDVLQETSVIGGSRDMPTLMLHKCCKTPGCLYAAIRIEELLLHEKQCSQERLDQIRADRSKLADVAAELACSYEGCNYVPAPGSVAKSAKQMLEDHVKNNHKYVPKPCAHGCEPEKLYYTTHTMRNHLVTKHSSRFPARCSYLECTNTTAFAKLSGLKRHIRTTHKLDDEEMVAYLPPPEPIRKYVDGQQCWIGSCDSEPRDRIAMGKHLRSDQHNVSVEEAAAEVDAMAQFDTIVVQPKPRKKAAMSTGQINRATGGEPVRKKAKRS